MRWWRLGVRVRGVAEAISIMTDTDGGGETGSN